MSAMKGTDHRRDSVKKIDWWVDKKDGGSAPPHPSMPITSLDALGPRSPMVSFVDDAMERPVRDAGVAEGKGGDDDESDGDDYPLEDVLGRAAAEARGMESRGGGGAAPASEPQRPAPGCNFFFASLFFRNPVSWCLEATSPL